MRDKPRQAKPGQAKPGQAKQGQDKPNKSKAKANAKAKARAKIIATPNQKTKKQAHSFSEKEMGWELALGKYQGLYGTKVG